MNTTKARKRLMSVVEQESYLRYPDETDVGDGDRVFVYGRRRDEGKCVRWTVQTVVPEDHGFTIGEDVACNDGRQQLLLTASVSVSSAVHGSDYKLSDVTVCQSDPITKCKDEIKHKFVQLCYMGLQNKYVIDGLLTDLDTPVLNNQDVRPLTAADIKVTTVREKGKSMHLGRSSDADYLYKLGVNWMSWHSSETTSRLNTLTHELCHCIHPHHKKSFFVEHARLIDSVTSSAVRQKRVERLFDGDIQWNKLKTLVMDGVHDQPKEIDTAGSQYRLAACEAVVEELEDILGYGHAVGQLFHTQPSKNRIQPRWVTEYSHDGDDEHPSREELSPDDIEKRTLAELHIDETVSDEELYAFFQDEIAEERDSGIRNFIYDHDQVPLVEKDGTVVDAGKLAVMFRRMVNESGVITENQVSPNTSIFVRPVSGS